MQVLFNYLPDQTFDYEGGTWICRVTRLESRCIDEEINREELLDRIRDHVHLWKESHRQGFPDLYSQRHLYTFLSPERVRFDLYPLSFRCVKCGRVYWYADVKELERKNLDLRCAVCGEGGALRQIYHVFIHECGAIRPAVPFRPCPRCGSYRDIVLDDRRSQHAKDFRWYCVRCGVEVGPIILPCPRCHPPGSGGARSDDVAKSMRLVPHRANIAYYEHHVTAVDIRREQSVPAATSRLQRDAAAVRRYLDGYDPGAERRHAAVVEDLEAQLKKPDLPPEVRQYLKARLAELTGSCGASEDLSGIPEGIGRVLEEYLYVTTGLRGRSIEEAAAVLERRLPGMGQPLRNAKRVLPYCGLLEPVLLEDFPVITAVFGYTRVEYAPEARYGDRVIRTTLCAFRRTDDGKVPVYTDRAQVEAILFRIDPVRVVGWLRSNGIRAAPAAAGEREARLWILQNAAGMQGGLHPANPWGTPGHLILCLVHSMCHIFIRAAARLTGFERGGLAEYLFPEAAAFVIYSNKTEFTIGGLHTLFEQQLRELLISAVRDSLSRTCVYDPVCLAEGGACHACLYLPETSCSRFNRDLGRVYLFGGEADGRRVYGFWELLFRSTAAGGTGV